MKRMKAEVAEASQRTQTALCGTCAPSALSSVRFAVAMLLLLSAAFAQELHKVNPGICGGCMEQPASWYGSAEAVRIADNFLLYQRNDGGWPKNIRMELPLAPADRAKEIDEKDLNDSTIDNSATWTQLRYLARVYSATNEPRFRDAFLRGIDYLFRAQYPNGGWPQFYPLRSNYSRHITFNDDAMTGVMDLLYDVSKGEAPFRFVNEARRKRAADAVAPGLQIILKTQIRVDGKLTAWCAQYDETTLAPASARTYELVSISGEESVGIVRFLMRLEPTPEITRAIESAVAWFEQSKLKSMRIEDKPDASLASGYDRVIVKDPSAPPIWARFYEIGTNRPFFSGRDGIKKYELTEIEYERRAHYAWLGYWPAELLARDYPAWKQRVAAASARNTAARGK